jgi:hypothetical protein
MARIKKPRPYERNMLIVCEDTNTGPNYLYYLKAIAIKNQFWDYIEISPKPPLQIEEENQTSPPHKSARKKRQFEKTEEDTHLTIELEKENREQPVRYVRTVQKALEEGSYSEGWAVYDLDGHTGHERAENIARQEPIVNIAFSSRAIEMWFLLHFEQNDRLFEKVHCKFNGREQQCDKTRNCIGEECLMGYLRRNTPLENYQKKADIFSLLNPEMRIAIKNSEWLRDKYVQNQALFERNPYTSMDYLVKSLLRLLSIFEIGKLKEFELRVLSIEPVTEIEIKNTTQHRQIINKNLFRFNNKQDFTLEGSGILEIDETKTIRISDYTPAPDLRLKFPADNEVDFFWILC